MMTGRSPAGSPSQETFTARPSTWIFSVPLKAFSWLAVVAGGCGAAASGASSQPASATVAHRAIAAETVLLRVMVSMSSLAGSAGEALRPRGKVGPRCPGRRHRAVGTRV
jgi:hypothetical protein